MTTISISLDPGRPEAVRRARELPLGFARDGLYTYSYVRRAVLLRTGAGAIKTVIAENLVRRRYGLRRGEGGRDYFLARGSCQRPRIAGPSHGFTSRSGTPTTRPCNRSAG